MTHARRHRRRFAREWGTCGSRRGAHTKSRKGITLYEVFLALIILVTAMSVLSTHVSVGTRAGVRGHLQTEAALLCQTKLNEVLAGVEPMTPVADIAIDTTTHPNWYWTLTVATGPNTGLLNLLVTVYHVDPQGTQNASFALRRYTRDPQIFIDASATAASSTSSSGSSTSSAGGL